MYRYALWPLLARLDPETAHDLVIGLLARLGPVPALHPLLRLGLDYRDHRIATTVWNLPFSNPLGIAAGLDKNGRAAPALLRMGWGHVEVGTVTPLPQPGNPRPRVFRLAEDGALINRMGFPGVGVDVVRANLARSWRGGIVGINVGANKHSVEAGTAAADYVRALEALYGLADYLTINVSSPNTARLRELQGKAALRALIAEVAGRRDQLSPRKPLLLKVAPDLEPAELDDVVEACLDYGIDGLVATNTTVVRPDTLRGHHAAQSGGLSGTPLRERADAIVHYLYRATAGRIPIIGVGGISTAEDAWRRLAAGASLVQVYTGFIYGGPRLAYHINRGLVRLMEQHGIASLAGVVGMAHS